LNSIVTMDIKRYFSFEYEENMEKRGSSHIEMVFAFILFIAVVLFVFYFFSYKSQVYDPSLSDYAFTQIEKKISSNVLEYTIAINASVNPSKRIIALNISLFDSSNGIAVKNYSGSPLKYKLNVNELNVNELNVDRESNNFFYVVISKYINLSEDNILIIESLNLSEYTLASVKNSTIISEKKFLELNKSYNEDYPALKEILGIGSKNDFSSSMKFSKVDYINMNMQIPEGYQVYAKTKRVEVIRENGLETFADVQVSVW